VLLAGGPPFRAVTALGGTGKPADAASDDLNVGGHVDLQPRRISGQVRFLPGDAYDDPKIADHEDPAGERVTVWTTRKHARMITRTTSGWGVRDVVPPVYERSGARDGRLVFCCVARGGDPRALARGRRPKPSPRPAPCGWMGGTGLPNLMIKEIPDGRVEGAAPRSPQWHLRRVDHRQNVTDGSFGLGGKGGLRARVIEAYMTWLEQGQGAAGAGSRDLLVPGIRSVWPVASS